MIRDGAVCNSRSDQFDYSMSVWFIILLPRLLAGGSKPFACGSSYTRSPVENPRPGARSFIVRAIVGGASLRLLSGFGPSTFQNACADDFTLFILRPFLKHPSSFGLGRFCFMAVYQGEGPQQRWRNALCLKKQEKSFWP